MILRLSFFLILFINLSSCSKHISLKKELGCSSSMSFQNSSERIDLHKNFKIKIPNKWKHQLYFDDFQSTIYMADTIKDLKESYIVDVSRKNGTLNLQDSFEEKLSTETKLIILKSNFEEFKNYPAYWNVSKGQKNNFTYHLFSLFIKTSEENYIEIRTELYGELLIDERLCESLILINSLEILK